MVAPSTSALLTQWDWEPSVLIGLLLLTAGYYYAVGPLRGKHNLGPPVTGRQQTCFVLSVLVLVVSLLSPLDDISDRYLFSAHMVQHLFLASVWPPLLLLSLPDWLVRPIFRRPALGSLISFFTYPGMAILLFNADIIVWHLPVLYDLTLSNETVHILEHLTFMAFGLFNWWPLLSPIREQRLSYPLQMLYLFADGMFMMVLGILFTFSPVVFYTAYQSAPRLWGISVLNDQQLGGLIMWYPGNIPYAVVLVTAFYRWFDAGQSPSPLGGEPERQAIPSPASTVGGSTSVEQR